ncbi:hypothetical protein SteCoe_14807 [Stentor coeruleus]|uniref:Uncharacterized protein n=1 Tax=Stentor coeruleus TaxID=5963 RepID=A0A1R2C548_9CILI|nr:hypothetical protein SteCoe_14807 [Stentor coeruleus]
MRLILKSFCKCCIIIDEPKESNETACKEPKLQDSEMTEQNNFSSVFRLKETRQRSVDYVVHSPRFGGNANLPKCSTGGTENVLVSSKK